LSDIVEQLQNLFIDNPPGKSRVGVSAEIAVNKVVKAVSEIVRLQAERDRLRDALEKLIERADDSDDARYGTMSTTYVRDIARAALKGDTF
jgi:hypothetical protein